MSGERRRGWSDAPQPRILGHISGGSMGQVTLYMDEDTMARMRAAAEAAGLSMSAWLGQLVQERTRMEWPRSVVELAGAWRDLPTAEELRAAQPADVRRETL